MAEHVHQGMANRGEQAGGGGLRVLAQGGVGRGDDEVERGQDLVVVVEAAVGEDVDLGAGQEPDAGDLRVGLADRLDVT